MPVVYCLEHPCDLETPKYGTIVVEGWAFSTDSDITKIEVAYGKKTIKADMNFEREDVAKCHSSYAMQAIKSGFRAEIQLTDREKRQNIDIVVSIYAGNSIIKIPPIRVLPDVAVVSKRGWFSNFLFAVRKVVDYFRAGKRPHNFKELKTCVYKFINLLFSNHETDNLKFKSNKTKYQIWCLKNELREKERSRLIEAEKQFLYRPLISIIMPAYKTDSRLLREALDSVNRQIYTNWEIYVVDDCSPTDNVRRIVGEYSLSDKRFHYFRMAKNSHISLASNQGVSLSSGEFIYLMDHDDLMTEDSLFYVVKQLNKDRDLDIIYSDDDKITMDNQRFDPQFKPDFSPELLLSFMYFSHIFVIRRTLFDSIGGFRAGYEGSQDYDLALRATEKTNRIAHIPRILYHWRATPTSTAHSTDSKPYSILNGLRAVQDAVKRRGIEAEVEMPEFAKTNKLGIYSLRYNGKAEPLISIIIPSKNHKELLERCINSIEKKTTYHNYEIIVVDNDSDDPETISYLHQIQHTVLKLENVNNKFNFSRMVNFGVRHSHGEYVVLLNNDTEVIAENWLENMLVYMRIDGVGAVGCKLIYPDHTIQHAGVVLKLGNGIAGHAFKLNHYQDGGLLGFANVARNYSAVTAACLMTSRSVYDEVGGFDEEDFSVSYNDVDFCLKVRQRKLRIVYNPEALLFHYEGKSRGVEQTGHYSDPKEEYRLISKWKLDQYFVDEYYNPNLSTEDEHFLVDERQVYAEEHIKAHVLLITQNLNLEGAPIVLQNVCRGLQAKGYRFTVLSMEDGPLREEYRALGIEVVIRKIDCNAQFLNRKMYARFLEELSQDFADKAVDLVYANTIECFWGIGLAEQLGVPSIWGIHESVNYKQYFAYLCAEVQKKAISYFSLATRVVFVSNATRALYQDLDTYNFITIHNGLNASYVEAFKQDHKRADIKRSLGINEDKKVVTIIGTVCQRKGQVVFAEAAKKLLTQREDVIFYVVGGKERGYYQQLARYIEENGLENHIRICDSCKDVYKYYMVSDVFVCASYEESSPMVILEAMFFEVPIVSTDVYGIPEQIRDGREGLLVKPGDPDAMAARINELLNKPELCRELTYNAYYRGLMQFSQQTMLQSYDIALQEAVVEGENYIFKSTLETNSKNIPL